MDEMNESREVGPIWGKTKRMEWTQEVGHSRKNGNGWNIGRLGNLVSWKLMMNMERLDNSRKWCGRFRVHPLAN